MEAVKILEKGSELSWDYDAEADVLYLSVGKPQPAEGVDIGEGVVLRYNPAQHELVGLTVVGLRSRLLKGLAQTAETESYVARDAPRRKRGE